MLMLVMYKGSWRKISTYVEWIVVCPEDCGLNI